MTHIAYTSMSPTERLSFNQYGTYDIKYVLSDKEWEDMLRNIEVGEGLIGEEAVGDVGTANVAERCVNCTNLCGLN